MSEPRYLVGKSDDPHDPTTYQSDDLDAHWHEDTKKSPLLAYAIWGVITWGVILLIAVWRYYA